MILLANENQKMMAFEIYLLNMHVSAKGVFVSFTGEETFGVN